MTASADDKFEAHSAGAEVSSVHPLATKVMAEIGIDLCGHRGKSVEEFLGQEFDYVITLCGDSAKKACPLFTGEAKRRLHWNFIDPAEAVGNDQELLAVFRRVRDEIKSKINEFLRESKELS